MGATIGAGLFHIGAPAREGVAVHFRGVAHILCYRYDKIGNAFFFDRHAVNLQNAIAHLNDVTGKADHALDIIRAIRHGCLEHHNIAALWFAGEYPPGYEGQREGQAIFGIAVRPFCNQQIIADEQAGLHRFRRNIEWRDDEAAQNEHENG